MATNIIASLHQANHKLLSEFDSYKRKSEGKIINLEDSVRRGEHDIRQLKLLLEESHSRKPLRDSLFWEERAKTVDTELKHTRELLNNEIRGSEYWFQMYSNLLNEKEVMNKQVETCRLENDALFHTLQATIICITESHNELEKHIKKEASVLPLLNMLRDRLSDSKKNT